MNLTRNQNSNRKKINFQLFPGIIKETEKNRSEKRLQKGITSVIKIWTHVIYFPFLNQSKNLIWRDFQCFFSVVPGKKIKFVPG